MLNFTRINQNQWMSSVFRSQPVWFFLVIIKNKSEYSLYLKSTHKLKEKHLIVKNTSLEICKLSAKVTYACYKK